MKISIIIPTYNSANFIKKAIESVFNQPYQNKELIVIDGGSTDNTADILTSYGSKLSWISEKDSGQANAINKGFKRATGDIVAWLNADDFYEPDIFMDIKNTFEVNPEAVIVYGNCNSISSKKTAVHIPPACLSAEKLINEGNFIYQPSSFYKNSAIKAVGQIDETLHYWMEYDLCIKLLQHGKSIYINRTLSNFSVREGQKSDLKNIIGMDKELLKISRKYGGKYFSKIFFSCLYHRVKYMLVKYA